MTTDPLELKVYEFPGNTGLGEEPTGDEKFPINGVGDELGMSGPHAVALFKRLQARHLIGMFRNAGNIPMYTVRVENLSDEGMRAIDVLPQQQLIDAFRQVIETAEDPESPGTPQQK